MIKGLLVFMVAVTVSGNEKLASGNVSIKDHDLKRMVSAEHEIDENIRKFKDNLEGLRTTVDFEPITV